MMNSYVLQNAEWSCTISAEFGSNIISLRHGDFPILREPKSIDDLKNSPVRYGFPMLLPPNRTANGVFWFDGKKYCLPINEASHNNHLHGFLHSTPFAVLSHTKTELETQFINSGAVFPFPFQIHILDRLDANGFLRTLTVTNTGTTPMPLVLGFHTAFTLPKSFCVPIGKRWCVNEHYIPTGAKEDLTQEQLSYRDGCILAGQKIGGFYEAAGNTAQIGDYIFQVQGFDQWILFNGDGKQDFLCVEPQLGPVNALNTGEYIRLEPNESITFTLRISPAVL